MKVKLVLRKCISQMFNDDKYSDIYCIMLGNNKTKGKIFY